MPSAQPRDVAAILWSLSSTRHTGAAGLVRAAMSHVQQNTAEYTGGQLAEVLSSLSEIVTGDSLDGDIGESHGSGSITGSGSSFPIAVGVLLGHLFQRLEENPEQFRCGAFYPSPLILNNILSCKF